MIYKISFDTFIDKLEYIKCQFLSKKYGMYFLYLVEMEF